MEGKFRTGSLFLQNKDGTFENHYQSAFMNNSTPEEIEAVFADIDNDKDLDIIIITGGNEFYGNMPELLDYIYINDGNANFRLAKDLLPPMYEQGSCIAISDIDFDGDNDIFIGNRSISYKYGLSPKSYLLRNEGGKFVDVTYSLAIAIDSFGMISDAQWADINNDSIAELVVVGEWLPISIFEWNEGILVNITEKVKSLAY